MKNPATNYTQDDFNRFTRSLKQRIDAGERVLVELRNGRIVPLTWFDGDGPEYEYFLCNKGTMYLIWNNDGTSVTSSDFDIMGDA